MFDHSVRVPLIVNGPGIEAGAKNGARIYLQDIMATSLELAGAERPDHVQFQSLVPLLKGEKEHGYPAIYGAYLDGQRAVTWNNHKLILYPKVPMALLFDLEKDPHEMTNLLENPENIPMAKKLFAELVALQLETGDTLDLREIYPEFVNKP